MAAPQQRYSGLRALAAKLGMGASTAGLTVDGAGGGAVDEDDDAAEGEPKGDDQEQQQPNGGGDDAGGDGEQGGDAENGDGDEDGDGDDGEAGGGEGAGGEGGGGDGSRDASYDRGFAAGGAATAGRWAATLLNDHCRANLELATDLLADTDFGPDKIAAYCERAGPGATAGSATGLQRLSTTPRPRVGLEGSDGKGGAPGEEDEGRNMRRTAARRASAGVRDRAKAAGVQPRKAGGARRALDQDTSAAGADK